MKIGGRHRSVDKHTGNKRCFCNHCEKKTKGGPEKHVQIKTVPRSGAVRGCCPVFSTAAPGPGALGPPGATGATGAPGLSANQVWKLPDGIIDTPLLTCFGKKM